MIVGDDLAEGKLVRPIHIGRPDGHADHSAGLREAVDDALTRTLRDWPFAEAEAGARA